MWPKDRTFKDCITGLEMNTIQTWGIGLDWGPKLGLLLYSNPAIWGPALQQSVLHCKVRCCMEIPSLPHPKHHSKNITPHIRLSLITWRWQWSLPCGNEWKLWTLSSLFCKKKGHLFFVYSNLKVQETNAVSHIPAVWTAWPSFFFVGQTDWAGLLEPCSNFNSTVH